MKYNYLPAPFFNHSIQPSPPTNAKLKSLHGVLRDQLPTEKWSHPFVACPPFDNFKILTPTYMLFQYDSNMIRQNTKFPPTAIFPRQT